MNIGIIGAGYVGLVTGTCLAELGNNIVFYDYNDGVVNMLNSGNSHFYEPKLAQLLKINLDKKCIGTVNNLNEMLNSVDYVFICVGTPSDESGIDLSYVNSAVISISNFLISNPKKYLRIIIKSTVIPGTCDSLNSEVFLKIGLTNFQYNLAMIPEFLREGSAVDDFFNADRVVIGCHPDYFNDYCDIFKGLSTTFLKVNTRTAEMIKYANNSILAAQISLINELSNYAEAVTDVDFNKVIEGVSLDSRWSLMDSNGKRLNPGILSYLKPGPGFGGSCFPKDVAAIVNAGKSKGLRMSILEKVLDVNVAQSEKVVLRLINSKNKYKIQSNRVLILGLSFKPETDDIRESPSTRIVNNLLKHGLEPYVHDPMALKNFKKLAISGVKYQQSIEEINGEFNMIILVTPWKEYLDLNYPKLFGNNSMAILFDTRGVLNLGDNSNLILLQPGKVANIV